MSFEITLGDIISWIVTIAAAVSVAVTVCIKVSVRDSSKNKKRISKSSQRDIAALGDVVGGDKHGK